MKDTYTSAAALFDGGWRSTDKEQLAAEYGLTPEEAEDLCEALARMGDHSDADADSKAAVIKDIRHYLGEIEALKAERCGHWQNGNREAYNRCSNDIADFNQSVRILKEAYHITDADINPPAAPTIDEFTALYDTLSDENKAIVIDAMKAALARQTEQQ